jgi:hypothetical protein
MIEHVFFTRPRKVYAVQWTGRNFEEIDQFVRDHCNKPGHHDAWVNENCYSDTLSLGAWGKEFVIFKHSWIVAHSWDNQGDVVTDSEFEDRCNRP